LIKFSLNNVYEGVFYIFKCKSYKYFRVDSNVEGITIRIENKEIYKTSDIEDYILTVIDYIKIEWDMKLLFMILEFMVIKIGVICTEFNIAWNKSMVLV
jgi:hypothetical protein